MTPIQHLAQAVLDGRADLAVPLADAILGLTFGHAHAIAERARIAERERIAERLLNEADYALRHFGELGEAQAAALEHVALELVYPDTTATPVE